MYTVKSGDPGIPQNRFFGFITPGKVQGNKIEQYVVGSFEFPITGKENNFRIWYLESEAAIELKMTEKTKIKRLNSNDATLTKKDLEELDGQLVAALIKANILSEEEPCEATKVYLVVLPTK
jgi:hypothetical protein